MALVDAPRIEEHAAIGDGRSVALVTARGAIDWLCWPRFDSPAIFAGLLDAERGGAWSLAPVGDARVRRAYLPGTNVVETRFAAPSGELALRDLMTVTTEEAKRTALVPEHELLRVVTCIRGDVEVAMRYEPRPRYGATRPRLSQLGALGVRCEIGAQLVTLRSDRALALDDDRAAASARFTLRAGESAVFSLVFDAHAAAVLPPLGEAALARVDETIAWWRSWIGAMTYEGDARGAVERSLLAVKLLGFAPSGAIVAAATTSLPERIGGDLNWDYRFCWLRDAAFTARALHGCGFPDDALAFSSWLLHATRLTRPALGVLYDVYGNVPRRERVLGHLRGYRGSRPVRIRNAAADQLQLDPYGEVIDAVVETIPPDARIDRGTAAMLRDFGRFVCRSWRKPDQGIWEGRGEPRHHTLSKVLCWVALDRLLGLAEAGRVRGAVDELRRERAAIAADVHAHGFDAALGSYTSAYGSAEIDASLLLLGWYGFEAPSSPRMQGTLARIEERLRAGPGLYHRDEASLRRGEGAFGICSFWMADVLARGGGSLHRAREVFEAAVRHRSDLGLFAEEIDPATGAALGNFPQAYTHVGLINAAMSIEERG